MKKLISILVLAIFLVSLLTPVFAEEGDKKEKDEPKVTGAASEKPMITAAKNTPGQAVSECMQELLKKQPNLLRSEAQARCRYREVKAQPAAERISEIKEANKERYIELRKGKLSDSIEKCEEKITDETSRSRCVESFEKRLKNTEKLIERAQQKLQDIEARKLEKIKKLNSVKNKEAFVKYNKENEFKAREISKTKLENAKNKFLKAKESYQTAKQKYQESKEMFRERKEQLKECTEDTEECQQIREEVRTRAREHLLNIADNILEKLNEIKSSIESNEELSEEEVAEALANLEEKTSQIQEAKAAVEAAETKEEVIEAAKTLKRAWSRMHNKIKVHAARTVNSRIGGIIVRSKQLEVKLERVLERMTENNQDVSAIEPLINDFNAKLEEARTHYETAVEKFKEAKAEEMPNTELVRESQTHMKDAHSSLQDAQKLLRDIIQAIKGAGGQDELEATETEDVDEEIEEIEEEGV